MRLANLKKKLANLNNRFKKRKKLRILVFSFVCILILAGVSYLFRGALFVAFVNGRPVTRYEYIRTLEKQSGSTVLDDLITRKLIEQEARNRGINISKEVIDQEIEEIRKTVSSQGTSLETLLSMKGLTLEDLEDDIRIQKQIEEMLKGDVNISAEDVQKYYEQNKDLYQGKKFEELKEDIRRQLEQDELRKKFSEFIQKLRGEANIKYLVDFPATNE